MSLSGRLRLIFNVQGAIVSLSDCVKKRGVANVESVN